MCDFYEARLSQSSNLMRAPLRKLRPARRRQRRSSYSLSVSELGGPAAQYMIACTSAAPETYAKKSAINDVGRRPKTIKLVVTL